MSLKENLCQLWQQKWNIFRLVFYDFSQNFLASYLGFAWGIIGPLVTLLILTLVFQIGFRVPPVSDSGVPFAVWLGCGMVPWFYFSEGLTSGVSVVSSYGFLVRKAMFRIAYLSPIRLLSAGFIHCVLMVFLVGLLLYSGVTPSLYWLQWFFYVVLMYLLLTGISWCTSSVAVFVPDMASILGIIANLGFWVTPIFWSPAMLPERWGWIFTANPVHYLVQGYRDAFIGQRWFWERPLAEHALFAVWLLIALCAGAFTFKKLRPHFADVL